MKAAIFETFGGPEVLQWRDIDTPEPGPKDVLVRVGAVSVNRTLDIAVRAGQYPRPVKLPHIPGVDPAGEIVTVGEEVKDRRVGQRVATYPLLVAGTRNSPPLMLGVGTWGGYAEYIVIPAHATHLIPDGLDDMQACVVARHAPLAFTLLRRKAQLKEGETVLVMGAAGGLGGCGVQVAKLSGARVIAAAGSDERVSSAVSLGADAGVNYREQDLVEAVMEFTDGRGVDVVFENVGDPVLFPRAFSSLGRYGRLITAGAHAGDEVTISLRKLYLNQITLMGSTLQDPADTDLALKYASEGKLSVPIGKVLPLDQAAEAHRLVESRAIAGKVVLVPPAI